MYIHRAMRSRASASNAIPAWLYANPMPWPPPWSTMIVRGPSLSARRAKAGSLTTAVRARRAVW